MSLQGIFDPVARAVLTKPYKETLKGILGHTPFVLKGDVETEIYANAFKNCQYITGIDLPSATSVGEEAFFSCQNLISVDISSATSIGEGAFNSCLSLTSVNMPSVTSIGMGAFIGCRALEKADLPSVTSIGQQAFGSCTALRTVILRTAETVCVADLTAFEGTPLLKGTGHIYVPSSMYEYYRAGYEAAVNVDMPGFFDILFRKIEDYPEICDGAVGEYYIEWDGNTEGRNVIELNTNGFSLHYYKVSDLIVDVISLDGSYIVDEKQAIVSPAYNYAVSLDGGAVVLSQGSPLVFSGKAGEYSLEGIDFEVPSDGTYFANDDGLWKIRVLYSHATE